MHTQSIVYWLLQSTALIDKNGLEIFEGDLVRIRTKSKTFEGTVSPIPDMFKSRKLHPLHDLLDAHGINDLEESLEIEVLGNRFEHPNLATNQRRPSQENRPLD